MRTNTKNILLILAMAIALTSCGDHGLDELLSDQSSSSTATNDKKSSSSKTKTSSSSINIVINDENIEPAASFAKNLFTFISFPFYEQYSWFSMSDLDWLIDNDNSNGNGKAFKSVFDKLSDNKAEYLSNGKFNRYIELLAGFIPRSVYIANGWDAMVRQLLAAYEDIAATDNFSEVYEFMKTEPNPYFYTSIDYYPGILDFVGEELDDAFFVEKNAVSYCCEVGEINRWAVVWAYSFWGRRYNEDPDSIEPIVDILLMLRDKYSK